MLLKLILENYVPLLSSNIHKVELDTEHMINLFISLNGVGKSSILKEMNPLPPENGNYENGRKFVQWKVGSKVYTMDSYTGIGNGHSFKIDDGEELNKNGTYSVQKELCETHFKLDSGLVKVISGIRIADRLSAMTPARRKDVLMQIYPNNTDYALGVYGRLKSARNELKAAIKNQVARYTEENRKLSYINECGVEELERRVKGLDEELKQSLLLRGSLESVKLDPETYRKKAELDMLMDRLLTTKLSGVYWSKREYADAIAQARRMLEGYKDQANVLHGVISEHAGMLEGLDEFLKDPDTFKAQTKHVKSDIAETLIKLEMIEQSLKQYPVFNDPESPLDGLAQIVPALMPFLNRVVPASTPELTGNQYKAYQTRLEVVQTTLRELNNNLSDWQHKYNHHEQAESVECPDCTHEFKLGMTPKQVVELKTTIDYSLAQIEKLEKEKKDLNNKLENDSEWFISMNQLFGFIRENSHVRILPELIKQFEVGRHASPRLQNALELVSRKAELLGYRDTLSEEEKLLDARIALLDRNHVLDVAIYVSTTEKELVAVNNKILFYKAKMDALSNTLRSIQTYGEDLERLEKLRFEILQGLECEGKVSLRSAVDNRITELTTDKDHYMASIIKSRSLTAVVQSISADIDRLKRRLTIVEVHMDGLCPNKGLIGKLMSDFINSICGNMNAVVNKIWNTPLFIKPCSKENGDLTYKFPVVKGEKTPTPDVSDCSGGETDILDWAFRFVLLGYLGFPLPLIMDEVGPFLDEIKRGRFFNFVEEYTQSNDARQLFLVSHYFNQLGVFRDPNIIALRYEGLTLPGEVNQHSIVI
jgi:hypothetical protein